MILSEAERAQFAQPFRQMPPVSPHIVEGMRRRQENQAARDRKVAALEAQIDAVNREHAQIDALIARRYGL